MKLWIAAILFVCLHNHHSTGQEWSYSGDNGPSKWYQEYPACGKKRQSPIDIQRDLAEKDESLSPFGFYGYSNTRTLRNLTVWNDGYTVTVRVHGHLEIEGGGLDGRYLLQHFHFHWGSQNNLGSEHWVDGQAYPLEIHLVHQTVRYEDIFTALKDPIGLAVLGIFIKIGKPHPRFQNIIDSLMELDLGDWGNVTPFPLNDILPSDTESYYRYYGSLTTPPCSESVVWTVFHEPVEMSQEQINQIRSISTMSNITENFRPIQGLNGRRITVRKKATDDDDDDEMSVSGDSMGNFTDDPRGNSSPFNKISNTFYTVICLTAVLSLFHVLH